jgi:hypothetical protein
MMGQLDDIVKLESKYASAITQNEKSLVEDKLKLSTKRIYQEQNHLRNSEH